MQKLEDVLSPLLTVPDFQMGVNYSNVTLELEIAMFLIVPCALQSIASGEPGLNGQHVLSLVEMELQQSLVHHLLYPKMEELNALEQAPKPCPVIHNVVLKIVHINHGLNGLLVPAVPISETEPELQSSITRQAAMDSHVLLLSPLEPFQTSPVIQLLEENVLGLKHALLVIQEIALEPTTPTEANVIVLLMDSEDTPSSLMLSQSLKSQRVPLVLTLMELSLTNLVPLPPKLLVQFLVLNHGHNGVNVLASQVPQQELTQSNKTHQIKEHHVIQQNKLMTSLMPVPQPQTVPLLVLFVSLMLIVMMS